MADVTNMNTLNTRIKLKYDEYTNWTSKNPVLLAGEVAIATIPSGTNVSTGADTTMQHLPNVVIKVGDGKTAYNLLPFVSALAADVYGWAKAPEKPSYTAGEIGGLDQFIAGEIQDTDTQYTVQSVAGSTYKFELMKKNKGDADTAYTHVAYIDLSEIDTRLDTLEGKVGDKSVTDQIADVVDDFNLTKLESASGSGKVLSYIEQSNGVVTAEMRSLVEADIPALSIAKTTGLQDALNAKQDDLTFTDDYAAATSVIATKKYVDDAAANAVKIDNGDAAVEGQFVTAAVQTNGEVTVSRRALKSTDFAADVVPESAVNGLTEALAAKQDKLTFESNPSATNKVATMTEVNAVAGTISGLNMTKVEVANGEILDTAVQENGQVTITKRALVTADFKADLIPESAVNGLTEALASKQENIAWADGYAYDATTNKAATVNYVASVIQGLNGAMHFIGAVATAEEVEGGLTLEQALINKGITNPQGGDVVLYGYDEYVYDAQNTEWVPLGNETIYQTIAQAQADHEALNQSIALKQNELGFEGTYNKETNKVVTVSAMNDAISSSINELGHTVVSGTAGTFARTVIQENGEVKVTYKGLEAADFTGKEDIVPKAAVAGLTEDLASKQNNLTFMSGTGEKKVATEDEISGINEAIADMALTQVDAANGRIITGLKQEAGVVTATTRELATADFKDNLINQSTIIGLAKTLSDADTAAQGYATTAETNAKNFASEEIGKAVGEIDFEIAAEEGKFVTGFKVEDGKLTTSTTSTVNAKYLTQTTGEYLLFDCGSASVNI